MGLIEHTVLGNLALQKAMDMEVFDVRACQHYYDSQGFEMYGPKLETDYDYSLTDYRLHYVHSKALKIIKANNLTENDYIIPDRYMNRRVDLFYLPFKC